MSEPLRLLLSDVPQVEPLIRGLLSQAGADNFRLDVAAATSEGLATGNHDLALIGGANGLRLIREAMAQRCETPLVLLLERPDRQAGQEALQAGAVDYLSHGELNVETLERIVRHVLARRRDRAALESMHAAEERKDAFLAILGHEIRNPLAPIRNGLHLLRLAGSSRQVIEQTLDMMDGQLRLLLRLLDDLMDLSRLDRGKIVLRKDRVELAEVVEAAIESTRSLIESRKHQFLVALPPRPVILEAEPMRLAQVVSQLLSNAARFTPPGGKIELMADVEAGTMVLRVRDSGVGIASEALPRVFERYGRLHRSGQHGPSGLGIGLSLVRGLVELHGGTVEVASQGPGRGSEFTIRLPTAS